MSLRSTNDCTLCRWWFVRTRRVATDGGSYQSACAEAPAGDTDQRTAPTWVPHQRKPAVKFSYLSALMHSSHLGELDSWQRLYSPLRCGTHRREVYLSRKPQLLRVHTAARREPVAATAQLRAAGVLPFASQVASLFAVQVITERSPDNGGGIPDSTEVSVLVRLGETTLAARLAPGLHPAVVETARARGELLIAQNTAQGLQLLGALRTSPTPGIEPGQDYVIEAERLTLRGNSEVNLVSGGAQVLLRAVGRVETIARDITARASQVHKLIGRALHLN